MITRTVRCRKGPLAGPFRVSSVAFPALASAACAQTRGVQDTYFAVSPLSWLVSLAAVTVAVLAAWWIVLGLARNRPRRLFVVTITAFCVGSALALLPLVPFGAATGLAIMANRLATFGATIAGLALIVTAVVLVWTLFAAIIDRL